MDDWIATTQVPTLLLVLLAIWFLLQWSNRLPRMESFQALVRVINSRGGNIILLACLSLYFFSVAMEFFRGTIYLIQIKRLTADNAIVLQAIQFITGMAFGGAFGALLKSMTGESSASRRGDEGKGGLPPAQQYDVTVQPKLAPAVAGAAVAKDTKK